MRPCPPRSTSLFALLILVAAGCVRTTTTVVVNDSGAGTAEIVLTVNAQAVLDQAGGGLVPLPAGLVPANTQAVCTNLGQAVDLVPRPAGATVSDYQGDAGFCGRVIRFPFSDPKALTRAFETLSGRKGDKDILIQDGNQWLFDAPLIEPIDLIPAQNQAIPPAVLKRLTAQRELTYVVTLPGQRSGDTNADNVTGGTFTWTVAADDTRNRLVALTRVDGGDDSGGPPVIPIALGAGLVLAAGAGAVLVKRSRRAPDPPSRGAEVPAAGLPNSWSPAAAAPAPAATPAEPIVAEPRWDPDRGAWVADHPTEGLLVHDDATGQWVRA
jgi:hypothetical protein